ncbi:MAG: NTP transferase domain-containing protein [Nitrososphaerota archaeon]
MPEQIMSVIMCGGRGRRMGGREKPLVEVLGKPLIKYAIEAVEGCQEITGLDFVTSINTPLTTRFLRQMGYEPFIGSGGGFLNDLSEYLAKKGEGSYLVVSCDVPTMTTYHIQEALRISQRHGEEYLMYVLPLESVRGLSKNPTIIERGGAHFQPAGLRLIRKKSVGPQNHSNPKLVVLHFRELGMNVNTLDDIKAAESYLKALRDLAKS